MKFRERVADRTARGVEHYVAMFGDLPVRQGDLLVDVGAGDSTIAHSLRECGVRVVSADPAYRHHPLRIQPPEGSVAVPRRANCIPEVGDSEAACVTVSHVYQHLTAEGIVASIREAVRMLRPRGTMLIGPVRRQPGLKTLPSNVTYREPTHTDGWRRPLGSVALIVPDDKDALDVDLLAGQLASPNVYYGKVSLAHLLTSACNTAMNEGDNRAYGYKEYELISIAGVGTASDTI